MAYFHTNYDASTMTVSVNDEEVSRALGVLANKTPAALKVAVNTTARQTRKLMLTEVRRGKRTSESGYPAIHCHAFQHDGSAAPAPAGAGGSV